jgi:hypothetical protein
MAVGSLIQKFPCTLEAVKSERGLFKPILKPSLEITRNLRISFPALSIPNADNIDIGFIKVKAGKKRPDRADTSWEGGPRPRSG